LFSIYRINLQITPNDAAAIVALRPAIENLITRVVENPEGFFPLEDLDQQLVNLVTDLSRKNYEEQQDTNSGESGNGSPWRGGISGGRGMGRGNRGMWRGRGGGPPFESMLGSSRSEDYSEEQDYSHNEQTAGMRYKKL
jgi:ATP-dependent RNA helicase A